MELKERLAKILKNRYGIESTEDLLKALDELPELDLGIFVSQQGEDAKSA